MNKKVYAKRGAKTVKGNGSAGEKDRITAIMGTLMDGTKLPLHFVIKGTAHPVNTRIKANLSTRYRNKPNISVQQNAWCDKDVIHDLVKHWRPFLKGKVLVICDSFGAHQHATMFVSPPGGKVTGGRVTTGPQMLIEKKMLPF